MRKRPAFWTSDEWATPPEIVREVEAEFGPFDLDACARRSTAKAARYYTKKDDSFQQPWNGRVWLNPPYSCPGPWLAKALQEINAGRASLIVALLPAATDTGWFHTYVIGKAEIRFRRGRIRFLGWAGTPIGSPKTGSVFAIYRRVR